MNKLLSLLCVLGLLIAGCSDDSSSPAADSQVTPDGSAGLDGTVPGDGTTPTADGATQDGATDQGGTTSDAAYTATLLAGAASVEISFSTPGVPLGGFGGSPRRNFSLASIPTILGVLGGGACGDPNRPKGNSMFEPNQGTHDPITSRALVLHSGHDKAAFIKLDAIGVTRKFRDELELEAGKLGIPKENLIVSATHTHSGPGAVSDQMLWQVIAMDCYHAKSYGEMLQASVDALTQANAALQPAKIGIGSVEEDRVSGNRMNRPEMVDHELGLIKVTKPDGAPIAALLNFAVHGTCLGADNMQFSADIMGYAERALETALGGGVAIFTNGAEGDRSPNQGGFDGAQVLGEMLADTASTLWPTLTTKDTVEIQGSYADVQMPPAVANGCMELADGQSLCDLIGFSVPIPIAAWMPTKIPFGALRLDDTVFATLPGEGITDIGLAVKDAGKQRGFTHTFVVGLANDHIGYAVTQELYATEEYEATSTLYGATTGQVVQDSMIQQIDAVKGP